MALIGITIGKSDITELAKLPAVKLLKGIVKLPDAPEQAGGNTDVLFKHSLKGAFCNM